MKTAIKAVIPALALAVASVVVAGVNVDYDKTIDFTRYKTFGWLDGTPASNPFAEERIRQAVEAQLAAKGLTKAAGPADIYVASHATTGNQTHITVDNYRTGPYRWGGGVTTGGDVMNVPLGTLTIDLVDGKSKDLVWRAMATEILSNKPETNQKKIDKVTKKIFKKYPPKLKKK